MRKIILLSIIAGALIWVSCTGKASGTGEQQPSRPSLIDTPNLVDTMVLRTALFHKELVSNGKLKAAEKTDLTFRTSEELAWLGVKNGDRVKAGQVIARLNDFTIRQQLAKVGLQLDKSWLELWDLLIGQGYDRGDSARIPGEILRIARLRSGFTAAEADYRSVSFELEGTELKAPFDGVIANLHHHLHEKVNSGEQFCTLIGNHDFEVEFTLLEPELSRINGDEEVVVQLLAANQTCKGRITEINPMVDENGLIRIKASLKNPGLFLDGMNVKVLVTAPVTGQLVVPKEAVVLRDNYQVLFRYTNGKAFWTYVVTGDENSSQYTVKANEDKGATLSAGDTIIISGNLNLAHESRVKIK